MLYTIYSTRETAKAKHAAFVIHLSLTISQDDFKSQKKRLKRNGWAIWYFGKKGKVEGWNAAEEEPDF